MPLNKEDPEIRELASDCIRYGRELRLMDHRLRLIRYVIFDRPATIESLLSAYQTRSLPMDVAEMHLDWLLDKGVLELKGEEYILTDDFYHLVREVHPMLLDKTL